MTQPISLTDSQKIVNRSLGLSGLRHDNVLGPGVVGQALLIVVGNAILERNIRRLRDVEAALYRQGASSPSGSFEYLDLYLYIGMALEYLEAGKNPDDAPFMRTYLEDIRREIG